MSKTVIAAVVLATGAWMCGAILGYMLGRADGVARVEAKPHVVHAKECPCREVKR